MALVNHKVRSISVVPEELWIFKDDEAFYQYYKDIAPVEQVDTKTELRYNVYPFEEAYIMIEDENSEILRTQSVSIGNQKIILQKLCKRL